MALKKKIAESIRKQIASDPSLATDLEQIAFDAEVATMVYTARQEAGLTQKELADLAGTQQSVIARLEDWDYSGHSLSMLRRIGDAVGKRLHVEFVPRFTEFTESAFSTTDSGLALIHWDTLLAPWAPVIQTTGSVDDGIDSYGLVA